ncbi:glycosyl hydrolase family 95 catalytic domain-containing protein [Acrocarpospora catenulata]|uniref:glycosyl hydrolase family 95 catalytic domain-containing protein n=1 Tax=Acrocarpospora catenulata TaxID=2836182 RepID=UPI001BD98028|nr:glycoside hydrolase N-terminal domain-containing protein [Acrocarpospora catenulata]
MQAQTAAESTTSSLQTPDDLTLWYDQPATNWETQALPIGNGPLGAKVFGGVATEQIQFNEKTLWTGGPGASNYNFGNWTSPRPGAIAEIQQLINSSGRVSPDTVAARLGQGKTNFGSYQTFGDLFLDIAGAPANPSAYRRELSLREAVARVGYSADGVAYSREYFASNPGNVIVGRLSADQGGKVSFTLRHTSPRNDKTVTAADGRLTIRGRLTNNQMAFEAQVQVIAQGGTRVDAGDRITVTGADSAVFVLSAGTDYSGVYPTYKGADPHAAVTANVDAAAAKTYEQLRAAHIADYRNLFDRVQLDLGQSTPTIPTDQLRRDYTGGSATQDRALEAMFFAYGRYLLISSSRENDILPANLQGVWNNVTNPPWDADYHVNINLQMNYWLAEQTNLHETTKPYDRYITNMVAPGRVTAQQMYGARGWVVNNETNPYGFTGVHNYAASFWFPEAAAWTTQHMYDTYRFTGDVDYLRDTAYPAIKGAAEFWLDFLYTDPRDGKLVVSPSFSPENGQFSAGASMSQQIVREVLTNALAAARKLDTDPGFQTEVSQALAKLDPGLRIGSWGQLQEWKTDWDSPTDTHRHVSHLFALHPGNQIVADSPEGRAARVSLNARGDGGTGWSKAWKINFWARLLDGDRAHKLLTEQLKSSTLDNLWDTHPPFQIDGNFGATAGIAEMLVQSQHDVVHVLPALPSTWKNGSVSGLRARGDVTVDAGWKDGAPDTITVRPGKTGPIKVKSSFVSGRYHVVDGQGNEVDADRAGDVLSWDATAGKSYTIKNEAGVTLTVPGAASPGTAFEAKVTVSAIGARELPASEVTLTVPNGWTATPATRQVAAIPSGSSRDATFTVTPGPADGSRSAQLSAKVDGGSWQGSASAILTLSPCASPAPGSVLVAWDPVSGNTVTDHSGNGRHANVTGSATYDNTAPTGSGLNLSTTSSMVTANTTLGFLPEATFAAEVKTGGTGYRRLFDSQPGGDPGTNGVLIDLTPSNQLRFIGAGTGVTINTTIPTGQWLDLVVTLDRTGLITVYVNGTQRATGQATSDGITGCTSRSLRFGVDQNNGQRLTGAVDRAAIFAKRLTTAEIANWRELAFADRTAPVTNATTQPALPASGWFTGPVSVTLSAVDEAQGSGVDRTEYQLDGGAWTAYTAPVAVSGDGSHTLAYRSADKAGNVETAKTLTVKVDATAPVSAATVEEATVTITATDATSGLERTEYSVDGGDWTAYTAPVTVTGDGEHQVRYRSADKAGNVEEAKSVTVTIATATVPLTVTATSRCVGATAYLAVTAVNGAEVPASITLTTPYGVKTVEGVEPGKQAYQSFNTRAKQLAAGTVTVTGTATIGGKQVTSSYEVAYTAISCG